jgi:insulysin
MRLQFWKYICVIGICLGTFLEGKEQPLFTVIPDQTQISILTPSLAQRQTLKLRLANGLEAYLIEDPEATHAGAVLTVKAGGWNDPDQYPGLAHFLEHMLFLGTEKYPIESQYDRFIRAHDGKSNAYTANDHTLYLFSINPSAFEEALDRFSFFFKKPLFNPSGVDRELNAVNQEFAKNFNLDNIREYHVKKALANPQHPFHRFKTGNSTTLGKVTQKILREWYQEHYSAHHMRLIVYGPHSLETLQKWVVEDFKDIPSTGKQLSYPQIPALAEEMQGKVVYIEPLKDLRDLRLTWEIPADLVRPASYRPDQLIASILGHEGKGSLLSILKAEGLANDVSCSSDRLGKKHLLFSLSIHLTQEGLDNVPQVIERCFQVIQNLQQQETPPYLFDELKKISTIRYQYPSRENTFDYLMNLGALFVHEEFSSFPEAGLVPQIFDPELNRQFLSCLTPQRVHLTVNAHQPSIHFDQKEPWIGVSYQVASLPNQQVLAWNQLPSHPQFHLPTPNPFIPQDLTLVNEMNRDHHSDNLLPTPRLLVDNDQAKIYFAADHRFFIPQTLWFFEIKTPAIESHDPMKVVLAELYIKCLEEALQTYSYPAQLADLSYTISRTHHGILFTLSGYRDNAEKLFETLLMHLKNCSPSKQLFSISKDALLRQYSNFNQESPLQQGMETYRNIIFESSSTSQERAEALKQVSYESLLDYMTHLFDQTYTEGMIYGNVNENQALQVWKKLQTTLTSQSYPAEQRTAEKVIMLPNQSGPYVIHQNAQSSGHAAILGIEAPEFSLKKRAAQQILAQAMNSAFYSTLRTKQQTGYLVFSKAEEYEKHLFSFFGVQSTTHDPRDLLARFELFIESFLQEMEKSELTPEYFEQIRQSLLNTLENTPQNLVETGQLLKTLAFKYDGDFEWMAKRIQSLKELTYEEFVDIAREFLGKQNKRRLAILVRGKSNHEFHYHSVAGPQNIREISNYTQK